MERFREKILTRGTADCPFSQYHLQLAKEDAVFAPTHWHPECEILFMKRGLAEIRCDKLTFALSPGQIAFIPPGALHAVHALQANSMYDAFVFSFDLLNLPSAHFFQKELIVPLKAGTHRFPYVLEPGQPHYGVVSDALTRICHCPPDSPKRKRIIFVSMVQVFGQMMDTLVPRERSAIQKGNSTLKQCLQYMQEHCDEHITLGQIAGQVHLHPNYLCAMFKDLTGQTVFQHLLQIRVEKAAELLRARTHSVAEAASVCGFDNTGYFAKKFKELMGCSPKEYSLRSR